MSIRNIFKGLFSPDENGVNTSKQKHEYTSWDIVVHSFKIYFSQTQFWIRPNLWLIFLSVPIITSPGAKAGLYQTVSSGLRDPALIKVQPRKEMKEGFTYYFWKALLISTIKWAVLAVVILATLFWIDQETWMLRIVSIIGFYGLVLWWLTSGFLYPILIDNPEMKVISIIREAALLGFRKPFDSLLYSVVSTLLGILGIILLGPVLLVTPTLRSIIHTQGYWFLTGKVVPSFMDLVEYTEEYYDKGNL